MILFLAGTSDARELAVRIRQAGHPLLATVVTENAAKSLRDADLHVRVGRLTAEEMAALIRETRAYGVVDASHPFAEEASRNAMEAARTAGVPYVRYERPAWIYDHHPRLTVVDSYEAAAEAAARLKGVVMLTTGSKTLDVFAKRLLHEPGVQLVARMLPRKENMEKCAALGIEQKQIVAMQGPFGPELNRALYRHFDVDVVVTKESGKAGAVDEKVTTALEMGLHVILISRPRLDYGTVYAEPDKIIRHIQQWKGEDNRDTTGVSTGHHTSRGD
ncbi:precorrin-6A reductase [Polycladomyces sp. WAk]|uniref:Precorrin-6A reductase n=1 Tax=Polycladomyces zharkentensis TaxID=2807616 RepID=A0ABS2WKM0_9BACL|nr:precorrin-6A reductase [Polycladomyces sp. WAk]MBN2910028.1 precorrin-6A reductase [Polycladomyces sp. WAk]